MQQLLEQVIIQNIILFSLADVSQVLEQVIIFL